MPSEKAPDRIHARLSLSDLEKSFPQTKFLLLEYTMDETEMNSHLNLLSELIKPQKKTQMSLNLGIATYAAIHFANSQAVHNGLGADELFGGYMNFRKEENLEEEVNKQMNQLWERNGGRDDRIASYLGCLNVLPFLSKKLINVALKVPMSLCIKPELERGVGEKFILRQIALKLKLYNAATRAKQAMQFGSKVAKAKWRGYEEIPKT